MVSWAFLFYIVGITAASWHFAYGIWLFCAKWGITVGENALRKFGYVCVVIALVFMFTGFVTLWAFRGPNWPGQAERVHAIEQGQQPQDTPQSNY